VRTGGRPCNSIRRSRLLLHACAVAAALAGACARNAAVPDASMGSGSDGAVAVRSIDVRQDETTLYVHYRTLTSIRDCTAQQAEMPRVWRLAVSARIGDASIREVVLFPQDESGQSVSMTFKKNAQGLWSVFAPCTITIPASRRER
jgi:hypothetical protein